MADQSPLLELIRRIRPGTEVEVIDVGKYLAVGFHCAPQHVWLALDRIEFSQSTERVLEVVANMLVACLDCRDDTHFTCHHEHYLMANKLRQFLGPDGFREFLDHAPLAVRGSVQAIASPAGENTPADPPPGTISLRKP